jgi:hypothetical protein
MRKARPILMSATMIRALLEGRKTQTRRIMKPQPELTPNMGMVWKGWAYGINFDGEKGTIRNFIQCNDAKYKKGICPYGQPGDLLWVRETITHGGYEGAPLAYAADGKHGSYEWPSHWKRHCRPSIHMPRPASRLTLELTGVRVERLQDISEADAIAEGIERVSGFGTGNTPQNIWQCYTVAQSGYHNPIHSYQSLWQSINGKDSWEQNPWVWVLEFKVHECNVDDFTQEGR